MKRFAVAYIGTMMSKYDRADIVGDQIKCYLKDKIVFAGDVSFVSRAQAETYLSIEIVESENAEMAMRKIIDASQYMTNRIVAEEIP